MAALIVALMPALELTDPPDLDQDVDTILVGNIFHRHKAQPGDTVRLELEAVGGVDLSFTT
jgi:hypothetical protein